MVSRTEQTEIAIGQTEGATQIFSRPLGAVAPDTPVRDPSRSVWPIPVLGHGLHPRNFCLKVKKFVKTGSKDWFYLHVSESMWKKESIQEYYLGDLEFEVSTLGIFWRKALQDELKKNVFIFSGNAAFFVTQHCLISPQMLEKLFQKYLTEEDFVEKLFDKLVLEHNLPIKEICKKTK